MTAIIKETPLDLFVHRVIECSEYNSLVENIISYWSERGVHIQSLILPMYVLGMTPEESSKIPTGSDVTQLLHNIYGDLYYEG